MKLTDIPIMDMQICQH